MSAATNVAARVALERIAHRVMAEYGFLTDFSEAAMSELEALPATDSRAR